MQRPPWTSDGIDFERPNAARIHDYLLGGSHNVAADRDAADQAVRRNPELPSILRATRRFLHRAVRFCVDAGIRQFLDLGSGIPTAGNVHEVAQHAAPGSRVVYVDADPVAVAHGVALLDGNPHATVVRADLRDVSGVLDAEPVRRLIDLSQPLAVVMVGVLHLVPDDHDPPGIVARYVRPVPDGSHLVVSHPANGPGPGDQAPDGVDPAGGDGAGATPRDPGQVVELFAGLPLVDPGLVYVNEWRPDEAVTPHRLPQLAGVARKTHGP